MIRSMTGFGAAAGPIGSQQVTLELRTVNHRFFNPSIKLPGALSQWEGELREQLRKGIARGHVTATARIERDATEVQAIDEEKVARYAELLRGLQQRHGLDGPLDMATILRFPDVLASGQDQQTAGTAAEVQKLASEALADLTHMREVEGARLADAARRADLGGRGERSPDRAAGAGAAGRGARAAEEGGAGAGAGVDLDQQRLAQEIALLADRLDVSEEVDRFRSHV